MKETVLKIAKALNEKEITWGLGGSLVLKNYGLVNKVNDIDIILLPEDVEKTIETLDTLGTKIEIVVKEEYETKIFCRYEVNGVEIDVMSRFIIKHENGSYEFLFDNETITDFEEVEGVRIPYTSLEDWFVAYMLMKNRDEKIRIIKEYFEVSGVKHPHLFERALKQNLPDKVKERIEEVLKYK